MKPRAFRMASPFCCWVLLAAGPALGDALDAQQPPPKRGSGRVRADRPAAAAGAAARGAAADRRLFGRVAGGGRLPVLDLAAPGRVEHELPSRPPHAQRQSPAAACHARHDRGALHLHPRVSCSSASSSDGFSARAPRTMRSPRSSSGARSERRGASRASSTPKRPSSQLAVPTALANANCQASSNNAQEFGWKLVWRWDFAWESALGSC